MPFATHILVPTDFSQASALATKAASLLAQQLGCKITLAHVYDPDGLRSPSQIGYAADGSDDIDGDVRRETRAALDRVRAELLDGGEDVQIELLEAESPARAICDRVSEIDADLIVIATHGRTGLKHLLIGSVAEQVVRQAQVPVLTLRSSIDD